MLKPCQVIITRHCGTAASSSCVISIFRESFAVLFLDVAITGEPWEPTAHLLPQLGSTISSMWEPLTRSSLWDPSRSVPCLFSLHLTSGTPQWQFFCRIWANRVILCSCFCWGGHFHQGVLKPSAAVMCITPLAITIFDGAWRRLLSSAEQEAAAKAQGCRALWETLGYPRHFLRAFKWNPVGDL